MRTLLVRCESDVPSMNIAEALLRRAEWSDLGEADGMSFMETEGFLMVSIGGLHIKSENLDKKVAEAGYGFDSIVFLSRHKAASGKPTLTIHPIGNYGAADFGGKPETLCPADPHLMTALFRGFSSAPQPDGFSSSFEVTHHGPFVSRPAMFLEIGSCEETWGSKEAADLLARTILEERPKGFPVVVGVGGGHYAPRFSEIAASYEVDFGHMLPSYHMKDVGDDAVLDMVAKACAATGSNVVYLHRKAFGRPEGRRIMELIETAGYETVASKDLNPAGTSR